MGRGAQYVVKDGHKVLMCADDPSQVRLFVKDTFTVCLEQLPISYNRSTSHRDSHNSLFVKECIPGGF